jgi:hypothetical protein
MSDAFITALDQRQLTHQEDRMTSQLNYLIAQQRQAELVSRAAHALLASEARLARHRHKPGTPRKLAAGPLRLRRRPLPECT